MLMDNVYRGLLADQHVSERKFSPYNAGSCAEKLYQHVVLKIPAEVPAKILWKFLIGRAVHTEVQSLLYKYRKFGDYTYKKSEKELVIKYREMELKGRADFWFTKDNKDWIADFKVVADDAFRYVKQGANDIYLTQLSLYAHAMNARNILLVYLNSKDGSYAEQAYETRDDLIERAYQRWNIVHNGTQAERADFSPTAPWECSYCQFAATCPFNVKRKKHVASTATGIATDVSDEVFQEAAKQYILSKKVADEAQAQADENREKLLQLCDFTTAGTIERDNLTIKRYASITKRYDKDTLEKLFTPEALEPALSVSERENFRIEIHEEGGN